MAFVTQHKAPSAYGDGRLERLDNGQREFPVNNVEYVSPNQLGSTQVKRVYFDRTTTGYVTTPASLTELKGMNIQVRTTNDGQSMWGYLATNNSNRWWYCRAEPANNRIRVDIASEIEGMRGWFDYV